MALPGVGSTLMILHGWRQPVRMLPVNSTKLSRARLFPERLLPVAIR
jgi:hypothetical protein